MNWHLSFCGNEMSRRRKYESISQLRLALLGIALSAGIVLCQSPVAAEEKLSQLSIEDLMEIEISSVAKKPRKVADSAAAAFVITAEDIRRSGVASIPEALRMVPGLQVAQVGSDKWAITSRGSNSLFANKLLVMIDGRTVYTPIFSGVFWNQQDTLLEDIARIEVIRGPGATLWGANAVNGVINIITRHASESQGTLVTGGGGSETQAVGGARYGGTIGDTAYRVYSKIREYDDTAALAGGTKPDDQWGSAQAGFRLDNELPDASKLMLEGDISRGDTRFDGTIPLLDQPFSQEISQAGGFHAMNLLGRWSKEISSESSVSVQGYFDRSRRDEVILRDAVDTVDLEAQHNFKILKNDEVIWGFGYRSLADRLTQTVPTLAFDPQGRQVEIFSGFAQNELNLLENSLTFTLGSKFQHNDYTGFEVQPSARAMWKPTQYQTLWAAFSRAVRTPSRAEASSQIQLETGRDTMTGLPFAYTAFGNRQISSEELMAYEVGYRAVVTSDFKFDLSTFFNQERSLIGLTPGEPSLSEAQGAPHLLVPASFQNNSNMDTFGSELVADWQICSRWRAQFGYTYQFYSFSPYGSRPGADYRGEERENPSHTASIRSLLNLSETVDLDGMLRFVDSIPQYDIDPFIELDMRFGWRILPNLEISVLGQNLLNNQHEEYTSNFIRFTPAQIQRSVFGKITWQFN